ncbi:YNL157W [Saccharomyces arboricola H-6]|uniref:mRNA stability protein n=1 Tax=Saccharomyces arboricola (strain H-6 / AS 2.3317 / CBS 10644) TaxID=1160507 RepID=J8PX94_SACAR|nr:YNL157W [Saccharomyces arboricola H-6]
MSNENISPNNSNTDLAGLTNDEGEIIDTSKFSPSEMKLYKMYGKLPSKKDIFKHTMQKRKYFDSGDYALQKAGIQNNDPVNYGRNNLPLTNPSKLREDIIKRRISTCPSTASAAGVVDSATLIQKEGSISSGPPSFNSGAIGGSSTSSTSTGNHVSSCSSLQDGSTTR